MKDFPILGTIGIFALIVCFCTIIALVIKLAFFSGTADYYQSGMHYQVTESGDVINITEDSLRVELLKNQYNILK